MATRLNILLVEDNNELREVTAEVLIAAGHLVKAVDCAEAVPELGARLDLVIVDLNLPGEDGLSLSKRIRSIQPDVGIIMVTARDLVSDKMLGYEHGADLYLPKPVAFEELLSAINALARRLDPLKSQRAWRLNADTMQLTSSQGDAVAVNSAEVAMLNAFAMAADHRLETWQLLELPGSPVAQNPKSALELRIVRLRKKLEKLGASAGSIKSLRGWGYQLCIQIQIE